MPKIWEDREIPAPRPRYLKLVQGKDAIDKGYVYLCIVDDSGEMEIGGIIAAIQSDGKMHIPSGIVRSTAALAGIKVDESGRIKMVL